MFQILEGGPQHVGFSRVHYMPPPVRKPNQTGRLGSKFDHTLPGLVGMISAANLP